MATLIDITYTDEYGREVHVEVTRAAGNAGGGYDVLVNRYLQGQIVLYNTGWKAFVRLDVLSKDDVDAIMDVVEGANR